MKKERKWIWYGIWGLLALAGGGGTLFCWMPRVPLLFAGGIAMLFLSVFGTAFLSERSRGKAGMKALRGGLILSALYLLALTGLTLLCDHVLFPGKHVYASLAVTLLTFILLFVLLLRIPGSYDPKLSWLKRGTALLLLAVGFVLSGFTQNWWWSVEQAEQAIRSFTPWQGDVSRFYPEQTELDQRVFLPGKYDLIVSPDGDDSNLGTEEAPLKTLVGAKERLKNVTADPSEIITVWFEEGRYLISEMVLFDADDRPNVCYCAKPGENVVFTASAAITNWKEGEINGCSAFVAELESDWQFRTLFKDGKRLPVSTWPKSGTFAVKDAKTEDSFHPDSDGWKVFGAFYAEPKNLLAFSEPDDIWIRISHKWVDDLMPLLNADPATGRVELARGAARDIVKGDPFVFENVRETVSEPGDWYLDRKEGRLYYIPAVGETTDTLVLEAPLVGEMILVDGAEGLTFQGIVFADSDWDFFDGEGPGYEESHPLYKNMRYRSGAYQANLGSPAAICVKNASRISFRDCRLQNLSYSAIRFDEMVTDSTVEACLITEVGGSAVIIDGADDPERASVNITMTDCEIDGYGRIFNQSPGIHLTYAENCRISNNEIHEGDYTGISAGWKWGYDEQVTRDIIIENNLIYNIGIDGLLSDLGGIYLLGPQPGTVLRGNIIFNIACYDYGATGIYLDAGSSELLIENNLVFDCATQCFTTSFGRNNTVRNNVFALGNRWGVGISEASDRTGENSLLFENNIVFTDKVPIGEETVPYTWLKESGNLLWDRHFQTVYCGKTVRIWQRSGVEAMKKNGYFLEDVIADPIFTDAEGRNFSLKENSPAEKTGFVPWNLTAGPTVKQEKAGR